MASPASKAIWFMTSAAAKVFIKSIWDKFDDFQIKKNTDPNMNWKIKSNICFNSCKMRIQLEWLLTWIGF